MDISHLLYFKTVVEAGSVSKAARELFISQPALSASIAKIEADVGTSLFTRTGRKITLNRSGEKYYENVVRALNAIRQGKHDAIAVAEETENIISLGAVTYISFSTLIGPFLKTQPDCKFKLWHVQSEQMVEKLMNGDLDFALTCSPVVSPSLGCYHVLTQKLYVTVPAAGHWLSGKSYVRLEELRDEPFILMNSESPFYNITMAIFEEAGFRPKVVCELETPSLMAGMINSGVGISLLPDTFAEHTSLRKVNVSHPKCIHDVYFTWVKNRAFSAVAQEFLKFVLEFYKNFPKTPDSV